MSLPSRVVGACRRLLTACLRFLSRLARLAFILGLMALPVPVAALVVGLLRPHRRNLPAEVLRKD